MTYLHIEVVPGPGIIGALVKRDKAIRAALLLGASALSSLVLLADAIDFPKDEFTDVSLCILFSGILSPGLAHSGLGESVGRDLCESSFGHSIL